MILKDRTTGRNIIWGTNSYAAMGEGFQYDDEITGGTVSVIRPRVEKAVVEQKKRTKGKAEVFTPSWICNTQNNLIDEAKFGWVAPPSLAERVAEVASWNLWQMDGLTFTVPGTNEHCIIKDWDRDVRLSFWHYLLINSTN